MAGIIFDYFTAAEAEQYTFYRIPKALFTEAHFQALSCEAKLLYGMMLDRMGLSIRNRWFDSLGRAYIIFTVEDVMGVMGCQSQKAVRLMKELDTVDGIGLIEKKRIGLGRPNRIYVKNFMTRTNSGEGPKESPRGNSDRKEADAPCGRDIAQERETTLANENGCEAAVLEMTGSVLEDARHKNKIRLESAAGMDNSHACREENWWMCGETMTENTDTGNLAINPGIPEEDWWEMADMDRDTKMPDADGNMRSGMEMEALQLQAALFGNSGRSASVETVDNVDKYGRAGNAMTENQKSDVNNRFSWEPDTDGKKSGYTQESFSPESDTKRMEMASFQPAGRKPGAAGTREKAFADKTVEAMVRELLCQEEKTAAGSGMEQAEQAGTGPEFPETQGMKFEKHGSALPDTETQELWNAKRNDTEYSETEYSKTECSKTEKNETDFSVSNPSYQFFKSNPSYQADPAGRKDGQDSDGCAETESAEGKMDAYREAIRENISYACFQPQETEDVDELVELMVDAMMVPDRQTIRIAGMEKPASVVKSRFMKLAHSHIQYVMGCLQKHTGKIRNIKSYLLTSLYNSSLTISSYYRSEVNHDLYGCVC